jgi:hypothetical protein
MLAGGGWGCSRALARLGACEFSRWTSSAAPAPTAQAIEEHARMGLSLMPALRSVVV